MLNALTGSYSYLQEGSLRGLKHLSASSRRLVADGNSLGLPDGRSWKISKLFLLSKESGSNSISTSSIVPES